MTAIIHGSEHQPNNVYYVDCKYFPSQPSKDSKEITQVLRNKKETRRYRKKMGLGTKGGCNLWRENSVLKN